RRRCYLAALRQLGCIINRADDGVQVAYIATAETIRGGTVKLFDQLPVHPRSPGLIHPVAHPSTISIQEFKLTVKPLSIYVLIVRQFQRIFERDSRVKRNRAPRSPSRFRLDDNNTIVSP